VYAPKFTSLNYGHGTILAESLHVYPAIAEAGCAILSFRR